MVIPPHNGFGSEEDSLLNVFQLKPKKALKGIIDTFKKEKHSLRFRAKLITQYEIETERKFILTFFVSDSTIQVFEEAEKNSGRASCKFMERQKVIHPYTTKPYSEKDFFVGATVYLNKYIFKLLECDRRSLNYMKDNSEIFHCSDISRIIKRIQAEKSKYNDPSDFLVEMLKVIDSTSAGSVPRENIVEGLKSFNLYLSPQEQITLFEFLEPIKDPKTDLYCMEDFYDIIQQF